MTDDWVDVDHDFDLAIDYSPSRWLEIPPRWETETWQDIDAWARECAELLWRAHDHDPAEPEMALFVGTLRRCADAFAPEDFDTRVLLHINDPLSMPLPVFAAVEPSEGEREETLRALIRADDPDAVEPPVVETYRAELLGEGLRAFRYVRQGDAPEVLAGLRYAWRDDELGADVALWTVADDIGQVMRATTDIESLTHKIQVRVLPPEPES